MITTIEEAKALGYEVVAASPIEVGLTKNGKGVRTWFCSRCASNLPALDNPEILRVINVHEKLVAVREKIGVVETELVRKKNRMIDETLHLVEVMLTALDRKQATIDDLRAKLARLKQFPPATLDGGDAPVNREK